MLEDFVLAKGSVNTERLLDDWSWLLGATHHVLLVTKMGNAFLLDGAGQVFFLDTLEGSLLPAAASFEAFKEKLKGGSINADWFSPDMVALAEGRGDRLGKGQVFAYKVPPVLGGSLESSNVAITDAVVHFSITGQLHEQVKHMKPGTRISGFKVEGT